MINKLLITCLQRNKRLVIPTLGAFIRKNIEGVGVILVFVPFLNKDDGVLCSAIKSWAGVEDEEAIQILEEYIAAVKKSLDERGQYIIEGVGVLKYDTNRIIYLAKESEAVKEEVVKPILEQKAEQTEQIQMPIAAQPKIEEPVAVPAPAPVVEQTSVVEQAPKPEPVSVINIDTKPATQFANQPSDDEPVKEPQIPQYNRPIYDRSTQTDMGTRYFSPIRRQEESVDAPNKEEQPKPNPAQMYGQPQQREGANPTYGRYRDSQQRINNIYGSNGGSTATPPPITQTQQNSERTIASPIVNNKRQQSSRHGARPQQKKRGNDMVLWVAIIAVALTVMVLIYGYIYGGEQTIDTEALIEQVQTESSANQIDGAAPTTEQAPTTNVN